MPIETKQPITALNQQEFHDLDYTVMAIAFSLHNSLGRFYDEVIYKNSMEQICSEQNLKIDKEVELKLTHKGYRKSLFIDLLIENSVYELKTTNAIQKAHQTQTLNYLFASNTQHGKIINFNPPSVEHEFVSTSLDLNSRKDIRFTINNWKNRSSHAENLKSTTEDLVKDWGGFFESRIYEEALVYLLGGQDNIIRPVPIQMNGTIVGHQKFNALSNTETFICTSYRQQNNKSKSHLSRLLEHSQFKTLYWINFNHSAVEFSVIEK